MDNDLHTHANTHTQRHTHTHTHIHTYIHTQHTTKVMALLVKHHKEIRRGNMIAQRASYRDEMLAKRREIRSKTSALRSSETTTAKIRDYHGMLM